MKETENLHSILSDIRTVLTSLDGQAKSGAEIHEIILKAAPNLNIRSIVDIPTGPGALTKFIEIYFPELRHVGMKGGDKLYGIGESVAVAPAIESPNIWKSFVSVNAVSDLCLNVPKMKLFASHSLDLDDDTHHIPRVTQEELDAIGQEFLLGLADDIRNKLEADLNQDFSYPEFLLAIRSNWLLKQWGEFRRNSLKQIFIKRLKKIHISEDSIPAVAAQLMESQNALYRSEDKRPSKGATSTARQPLRTVTRTDSQNLESARSLARSAIDNMGYDELRAVQLPFGAVLDALDIRN